MSIAPVNNPSLIKSWQADARIALRQKQLATAENYCKKLIDSNPRDPEGHFVLAMVARERGQISPAAKLLSRAVAFCPHNPEYLAQYAHTLVAVDKNELAQATAGQAFSLQPADAHILDTIGCVYSHTGNHAAAIAPFIQATDAAPDNAKFQCNLGASLLFLGRFDEAEAAYERAITADPGFFKAHWSLASVRRQTAESNHIERLQATIDAAAGDKVAEAMLNNALAKEYDDVGDADSAFKYLSASNSSARSRFKYSTKEDEQLIDAIIKVFQDGLPADKDAGDPSDAPIFVVGMPRTGTTLVERILSSHSNVHSAGELRCFNQKMNELTGSKKLKPLKPATIDAAARLKPAALGQAYLECASPRTGDTPCFVDKMPVNFLNIGLISRALPNAKIVCLRRNPMDTCLSNFRQMFAIEGAPYYRYSYNLLETGCFYILFDRLMQHWEELLPGKVHTLQYEELVADQKTQTRRLLEHCKLEWQPACLEFEKNTSPVDTASSAQVRQPIYSDATARWKRYEQHLQPLKELLEANGITI